MIERIGRVNNPLTIIAIFAGLAEVSGTIVLPLLKENVQTIYVWFLMGFPSALVAFFFYVLWHKREVLYAPSDYRDDSSFLRFLPSSKSPLDNLEKTLSPIVSITDYQAKSLLAIELVLKELNRELNIIFERNVSAKNNLNVSFDAVASTAQAMYVVEIKYSLGGSLSKTSIETVFRNINSLYTTLTNEMQEKFTFVFAVVVDDDTDSSSISVIKKNIYSLNDYRFHTDVKVWKFNDLVEKNSQ